MQVTKSEDYYTQTSPLPSAKTNQQRRISSPTICSFNHEAIHYMNSMQIVQRNYAKRLRR